MLIIGEAGYKVYGNSVLSPQFFYELKYNKEGKKRGGNENTVCKREQMG